MRADRNETRSAAWTGSGGEPHSTAIPSRRRLDSEAGSVLAFGWTAVVVAVMALVVVVDVAAYLAAFQRAQTAADAAALAAVARSDPRARQPGNPRTGARRVAAANDADLVSCDCRPGTRLVTVEVAMPVHAVAVTRFAARTVVATARSRLERVEYGSGASPEMPSPTPG